MTTKRKILVCGASGFIGFNAFQRLSQRNDFEVHGTYLTNQYHRIPTPDPRLHKADLTEVRDVEQIFKNQNFDAVILTAANSSGSKDDKKQPEIHVTNNNIINSRIFRAAHDYSVGQLIFPSCCIMYQDSNTPLKETDVDLNAGLREVHFGGGWMKLYHEKQAEFFSRRGRTKYTVLRQSNLYGPHDRFDYERSHVTAATISKVLTAKDKIQSSGKNQERDLLYIDDLLDLYELILDRQDYIFDLFNVGYGQTVTIGELVEKTVVASGKKLEIEFRQSHDSIGAKISVDISKVKAKFGWKPKINLDEGLAKTLAWRQAELVKDNLKTRSGR